MFLVIVKESANQSKKTLDRVDNVSHAVAYYSMIAIGCEPTKAQSRSIRAQLYTHKKSVIVCSDYDQAVYVTSRVQKANEAKRWDVFIIGVDAALENDTF